ncbi:MAG: hypothetical protein PWQ97_416 [Tepidanaerobacteraceae bacterium]|nr:hypothetical protein [Tepidanaerobacteraceae bacterium]
MNRKIKSLTGCLCLCIMFAAAGLAGCAFREYPARADSMVILSQDVLRQSTIEDKTVKVPQTREISLQQSIGYRDILAIDGQHILYRKDHVLYTVDMNGLNPQLLANLDVNEASRDGKKVMYLDKDQYFVYDLKSKSKTPLIKKQGQDGEPYFADEKGGYVSYFDFKHSNLNVIDTQTSETHALDFKKLFTLENFMLEDVKIYMDKVYVATHSKKDGYGIYELSFDGQKKAIVQYPPEKQDSDTLAGFDLINGGKTVIFNGTYDDESGIFFYDVDKKSLTKVISGGLDKEGQWTPFYSLSPDGTKIVFDNIVRDKDTVKNDIYVADITDGGLSQAIRIMENVKMPAVISLMAHWSDDSSKLYIKMPSSGGDSDLIDKIQEFAF